MKSPNLNLAAISHTRDLINQHYGPLPTPAKSYVVLMTPRSGSNLLCNALRDGGAGRPIESFHKERVLRQEHGWDIDFKNPYEYFRQMLLYQTQNNIFGFKMNWQQFQQFLKLARQLSEKVQAPPLNERELLEVFFPNLIYIHNKRRDKLAQAVSFSKALQTGIWARPKNSKIRSLHSAHYDRDLITLSMWKLLSIDTSWIRFLNQYQIPYLEVWYEDLAANFSEEIARVYRYLEIEASPPPSSLTKQANKLNAEWTERFRQETPWITDSPFTQYLSEGDLEQAFIWLSLHLAFTLHTRYWETSPLYQKHVKRQRWIEIRSRIITALKGKN